MTDPQNLDDLHIVAMTIDGEAENQGPMGMQAVACVIQNRVKFQWQGETTARGVCLHHEQFSCWNQGPDRARILALQDSNHFMSLCLDIAGDLFAGTLEDITGGADSYQVTGTNAYWSKGLTPVKIIGNQEFYITRGAP